MGGRRVEQESSPLYRELARKGEAEAREQGGRSGPPPQACVTKTCRGTRLFFGPCAAQRRGSARGLAAACGINLFLERVETDRADDDIGANHIARRAVEAERLGQLEAFFKGSFDLVAGHVLLQACHVESDVLRGCERTRKVRRAASAEQLLVEFEIFLAALVLHAHGRSHLRRLDRAFAQHREFLEHEFKLAVALDEIEHVVHGALAVAAIVVEEFDHRAVALRIAQRHLPRRAEKRSAVLLHARAMLFRFRGGLPLFELVHHLLQQFGIAQQIVLHDALNLAALIAAEGLGLRERRGGYRQRECEQRGSERTRIKFHCCWSFCHQRRKALRGGLRLARSSALTQPGDPTGKRDLARVAISRAVLMSPRMKAAWAEARSARARSFFWP